MLTLQSLYKTEVVFARIVIPRSASIGLLSSILSLICSLSLKVWEEVKRELTKVVFPWSTWAMMATLRMFIENLLSFKTKK